MKLSSLAPQSVCAIVRKLRFARRNAGFVPYAGESLNAQHMDQVHLYALPRGAA